MLYITIVLFILLYAAGCLVYGDRGFTNLQTFLNLFRTNAGLICVACGITCVMLTGGIDISVGLPGGSGLYAPRLRHERLGA